MKRIPPTGAGRLLTRLRAANASWVNRAVGSFVLLCVFALSTVVWSNQASAAGTISGRVFEDVNYGGGPGLTLTQAAGATPMSGARVELYAADGALLQTTNTDDTGQYSFASQPSGEYQVRAVPPDMSTRGGPGLVVPLVQTYRIDGVGESAGFGASRVGGERPHLPDAPPNPGALSLADLQTTTHWTHSIVRVSNDAGSVAGVDFGFTANAVVHAGPSGRGSLAQAIANANALHGDALLATRGRAAQVEHVVFALPTSDPSYDSVDNVWKVALDAPLPAITSPLFLDATLQPGYAARPVVQLDGLAAGGASGISISSGPVVVRGFSIGHFARHGIWLGPLAVNASIASNYVGATPAGAPIPNAISGVAVEGGSNTVGGTVGGRNLIAFNRDGVQLSGAGATLNTVSHNYIGILLNGQTPAGDLAGDGVAINGGATRNTVGPGNTIAHYRRGAVVSDAARRNTITANAIFGNDELGIDLNGDGVTANDAGDGDSGPNDLQNWPTITSASLAGATVSVNFAIDGPAGTHVIEAYADDLADPGQPNGEGRRYLGGTSFTHAGTGNYTLAFPWSGGTQLTLTATDADGNTSEFSNSYQVGPSGHWRFDETAGITALDSSGRGNDGTYVGGAARVPGGVAQTALSTPASSHVSVPDPADGALDFGAGDFSISLWLNSAQLPGPGAYPQILSKLSGAPGSEVGYEIHADGDNPGRINVVLHAGGATYSLGTTGWLDGAWHHLAVRRAGSSIGVYRDGVLITSEVLSPTWNFGDTAAPLVFGYRPPLAAWSDYEGYLDSVRIYKRALEPSEIAAHAQENRYAAADFRFEHPPGAIAVDSSGRRNDGAIVAPTALGPGAIAAGLDDTAPAGQVAVADAPAINFGASDFSFSTWFSTSRVLATGEDAYYLVKRAPATGARGWALYESGTTGELVFKLWDRDDESQARHVSTRTRSDGRWHHVAGRRTGNTIDLWLDGALAASFDATAAGGIAGISNTSPLLFGAGSPAGAQDYTGRLDQIALYPYALTPGDIAALFGAAPSISGRVFEDVNYGGGPGRSLAAAGTSAVALDGARVELYDVDGMFVDAQTTGSGGHYSFTALAPGSYTVRVVAATVTSSRGTGAVLIPTYSASAVTPVGGAAPHLPDAPANTTAATLASLQSATHWPSATAAITATAAVGGVDFGFNGNTVVNTNPTGPGSLAQFIANAAALNGDDQLQQSGLPAGIDSSVFMLPATDPNSAAGHWTIALPAPLDLNTRARLDARTQPGYAGAPVVRLDGTGRGAGDNVSITAPGAAVTGFSIVNSARHGVSVAATDATIADNYIGLGTTGAAQGNAAAGVELTSSRAAVTGNRIAYNTGPGVAIIGDGSAGNAIARNAIYDNGGLGIDLGADGPDTNDADDADGGPNLRQNHPTIGAATPGPFTTTVSGTMTGAPSTAYLLRVYASAQADPSGHGEGARYLGEFLVVTTASGAAAFIWTLPAGSSAGEWLTATAADAAGNTSEFSAAWLLGANQPPVADAGGPYSIAEGDPLTLNATGSTDPDGTVAAFAWDLDGDGAFDDASGATPTLTWAQLRAIGIDDNGGRTIAVRATDGGGAFTVDTAPLSITNTAPSLSASGAATVGVSQSYTLNLSSSDPGADTITEWRIDWGDGTYETVPGSATSASHSYTRAGLAFSIQVAAVDEDGVWWAGGDLLVPGRATPGGFVGRYTAPTGQFAANVGTLAGAAGAAVVIVGPGRAPFVGYETGHIARVEPTSGAAALFADATASGHGAIRDLAFGSDGLLYVLTATGVYRFDATTGAYAGRFVDASDPANGLGEPSALAFAPDGRLLVADAASSQVRRFDGATGAPLGVALSSAALSGPARFVLRNGSWYVASRANNRIVRIDPGGDAVVVDGGGLAGPQGLMFGPGGDLYAAAQGNSGVLSYSPAGAYLGDYVGAGSGGLADAAYGAFLPAHQVRVAPVALTGRVYEDPNYPGGPGRAYSSALGMTGVGNARVEIYDASGSFVGATATAADGTWSHTVPTADPYHVRVVNSTVRSSRSGSDGSERLVMTYRPASVGEPRDFHLTRIGGDVPWLADAGANVSGLPLGALGSSGAWPQSVALVSPGAGADFGFNAAVVANTNNSGAGSLRQAITNANLLDGDTSLSYGLSSRVDGVENIIFALRADEPTYSVGAWTIAPATPLPDLDTPMVIDAREQAGYTGEPLVVIDGGAGIVTGFRATARVELHGLSVVRFGAGITLAAGTAGSTLTSNYIGVRPGGVAAGNTGDGVVVEDASATIDGNAIGANGGAGIRLSGTAARLARIARNSIGAFGPQLRPNSVGIDLGAGAANNSIGGAAPDVNLIAGNTNDGVRIAGAGSDANTIGNNIITANGRAGVRISGGQGHTVTANAIGFDPADASRPGNSGDGILIDGAVAGVVIGTPLAPNTIRNNGGAGVRVDGAAQAVDVRANSISHNAGLAIDLGPTGVTPNDDDSGPDGLQNWPVLEVALTRDGSTFVAGTLDSVPNQAYTIRVYASGLADPSGYGEGEHYIGEFPVTTDGTGRAAFSHWFPTTPGGQVLALTATSSTGSTSEFSNALDAPESHAIRGRISEDVDGNGTSESGVSGVTVHLYRDNGDGVRGGADVLIATATTGASGDYDFGLRADGTYFVVADSKTVTPSQGYRSGYALADVWPDQTVYSAGAYDFGGQLFQATSDDASSLVTAGHIVRRSNAGADQTDIDFGFSFTVVRRTYDADDAPGPNNRTVQGSLRQFVQNANAIAGVQTSRFQLLATDPNFSPTTGSWRLALAAPLPIVLDRTSLDATTQPGWVDRPAVFLDGVLTTGDGITLVGGGSVRGFAIGNWSGAGISLPSAAAPVTVASNWIGVSPAGAAVPNATFGLSVLDGTHVIGGPDPASANVVSGNGIAGVLLMNGADTVVLGNSIGVTPDGTAPRPNAGAGIAVVNGHGHLVASNTISGNDDVGIVLVGVRDINVTGNRIGTDRTGLAPIANGGSGIHIDNSTHVAIGDGSATGPNTIAANLGDGVAVHGDATRFVSIAGNYIGVGSNGSTPLGNGGSGVRVSGQAADTTIGGLGPAGNVIAHSGGPGVALVSATRTTIDGNRIAANAGDGVQLDLLSHQNTIGATGRSNTIVDNGGAGVAIIGGSSGNEVRANHIGVDAGGVTPGPNAREGVYISGSRNTVVDNDIAFNGRAGVAVVIAAQENPVVLNRIRDNVGLAIDLADDGPTANDLGDADSGPNELMNAPVLTSAVVAGAEVRVRYQLDLGPGDYRIDYYGSPATFLHGAPEAAVHVGTQLVTTTGAPVAGTVAFTAGSHAYVSATVTRCAGGALCSSLAATSELSNIAPISATASSIGGRAFEDVDYGGGTGRPYAPGMPLAGGVRIELYTGDGTFIDATSTDGSGAYTFGDLAPGQYLVRAVSATVDSARGPGLGALGVQTFRRDGAGEAPGTGADRVGGEYPAREDVGENPGAWPLGVMNAGAAYTNSIVRLDLNTPVNDADFGFNFDTIVNTNDAGQGSLRRFIDNANALAGEAALAQAGLAPGFETSIFRIPAGDPGFTGGQFRIRLASPLPALAGPNSRLDGSVQTAATGDTTAAVPGVTTGPEVALVYEGAAAAPVLDIAGLSARIVNIGFLSTGAATAGVRVSGATDAELRTIDVTGVGATGVVIDSSADVELVDSVVRDNGHTAGGAGVAISNDSDGVAIVDTDVTANGGHGIDIVGSAVNVYIASSRITGNGTLGGPMAAGVAVRKTDDDQGGTGPISDVTILSNTIALNAGDGVLVTGGADDVTILRNSMYANGELGIDLAAARDPSAGSRGDGVTQNDPGDTDTGGNQLQNHPVITTAVTAAGTTRVTFDIDDAPGSLLVEVYGSGDGEGLVLFNAAVIDHAGGTASYAVTFPATRGFVVTATATDCLDGRDCVDRGATSEFGAALEVNQAPVFDQDLLDRSDLEGTPISLAASATDPDATDVLVYTAANLPPGLAIDPSSGVISGTVDYVAAAASPYAVVVTVDDGRAGIATDAFTWTVVNVNRAPVLDSPAAASTGELVPYSFTATATDPDLPDDTLAFSLEGTVPAGASIDATTGVFNWTPTELQGPGIYAFDVVVSDAGMPVLTDRRTLTIEVAEVNSTPSVSAPANLTVDEQTALQFTATATDPDIPPNQLRFSLAGAPPGASIDAISGQFNWTPSEAQGPGVYTFDVVVDDDGNPSLAARQPVTVTVGEVNLPPGLVIVGDQTIPEMVGFSFIALATDPDVPANSLTFALAGAPAGASIDPATGTFTWTPSEVQGPGVYTFDVIVVDGGTPSMSDRKTLTLTVAEVNVAPQVLSPGDLKRAETDSISLAIAATDSDVPANTLTWEAENLPAGLAIDPSTGVIKGTITYDAAAASPYKVKITVVDSGNPTLATTIAFEWAIANTNRAPVLEPIGEFKANELELLTLSPRAADPDADALVFTLNGAPSGVSIDPHTGRISWIPSEAQGPGVYRFEVVVTDNGTPAPLEARRAVSIEVLEVNSPPRLDGPSAVSVVTGDVGRAQVTTGDGDLPPNRVQLVLVSGPRGLTFNAATGEIEWNTLGVAPGRYAAVVEAIDDGVPPLSTQRTIEFVIGLAPVPNALDDRLAADGNTTTVLDVMANDADPERGPLALVALTQPPDGRVEIVDGKVRFTPTLEFDGETSFTYTVESARLARATARTTVEVRVPTLARDDRHDLPDFREVLLPVMANDRRSQYAQVRIINVNPPARGAAEIAGDQIVFRPEPGYVGATNFVYTLQDERGSLSTATVQINIDSNAITRSRSLVQELGTELLAVTEDPPAPGSISATREARVSSADHLVTPDVSRAVYQTLRGLEIPVLVLALGTGWVVLLASALSLLHRRRRIFAAIETARDEIVVAYATPGGGEIVFRFRPDEQLVWSRGRIRRVDGARWLPVETPHGPGWVAFDVLAPSLEVAEA